MGELFSFLSGLYFRGKLAYATAFSRPPSDIAGIWVITSNRGLLPTETPITVRDLQAFARVPVKVHERRYRTPLIRDAERLADTLPAHCDVVLLGSVATTKYVDLLTRCFGNRLRFPAEFVGRGDMSRGGLLLRCVAAGTELNYVPVDGATRRGRRPPKLSAGYR